MMTDDATRCVAQHAVARFVTGVAHQMRRPGCEIDIVRLHNDTPPIAPSRSMVLMMVSIAGSLSRLTRACNRAAALPLDERYSALLTLDPRDRDTGRGREHSTLQAGRTRCTACSPHASPHERCVSRVH